MNLHRCNEGWINHVPTFTQPDISSAILWGVLVNDLPGAAIADPPRRALDSCMLSAPEIANFLLILKRGSRLDIAKFLQEEQNCVQHLIIGLNIGRTLAIRDKPYRCPK